ncbi:GNAT family N-acetyltransferase [Clostridium gasigenes]|uniref:GNAT family N-acetyltransferase n=1 Tax=Clostridium gasigenes TaxID=94869 RepID=UPI001C0B0473|nr:GNAT family N-acetyltransferase [Clostridium gasigenes]MBU3105820.1 GNAT family N-acetyltransferase [Clostridium gasigenes]
MDIIKTNRLVFREFTQADIDNLFLLLSDPIVMKYCSGTINMIGTQKWLDIAIESYEKYGYDYWAVYERDTDTFLGQIGILNQEIDGTQEDCLAFMIGQKYWNKGYVTEGAIACINYAFKYLKLEKLIATVEPENLQSIFVLRKIGMKYIREANYGDEKVHVYSINKSSCHV